jgi:3-dehydroshikimate dehydratase
MNLSDKGRPGLVTVTFRQLSPKEIVAVAKSAGLEVLEWGGDVHVPLGNTRRAREVAALTCAAGLKTVGYGSYYRVGHGGENGSPHFSAVLETAEALGAPLIRVWAGSMGSDDADDVYFDRVCSDAVCIASAAAARGIKVAFEFHGGTLADNPASARRFYSALSDRRIHSLWQPLHSLDRRAQDESLEVILPHLAHVHVYHWAPGSVVERRPLAEGQAAWSAWMRRIAAAGHKPDYLLEFICDDNPANLAEDAANLRLWLGSLPHGGCKIRP